VVHHIHVGTHFPNQIRISKIGMHDIQVGVVEQMIQIAFLPGAQIVHDGDRMLLMEKQFRQMRSYESVSAGDENAHLLALLDVANVISREKSVAKVGRVQRLRKIWRMHCRYLANDASQSKTIHASRLTFRLLSTTVNYRLGSANTITWCRAATSAVDYRFYSATTSELP
jgi:hypothetical protein